MINSNSTTNLLNVKSFKTVLTLMIKHTKLMMSKAVRKAGAALYYHKHG